jgi:hypothetical protein
VSDINFEKIVVAPQIVIYKNIFKNSKDLIQILNDESKDTILSPWKDWYTNGYRRHCMFFIDTEIDEKDSLRIKKEKKYLKEFSNILNFIKKDYFNDFENKNGIWPNFIENWEKVKEFPDHYFIDFFKYDIKKAEVSEKNKLYMQYHVDEFPILNDFKSLRNIVTINLYLNNNYEGGEICAYDLNNKKSYIYKPAPGDAVVMPSTSPFYHGVKNFYNADRYFMRGFFKYESNGKNLEYNEAEKQIDAYVKDHLQTIKIDSEEVIIK